MLFFTYEKNSHIDELKHKLEIEHHHQLDSAFLSYQEESEIIFNNMINKEDVLILQKNALFAKDEESRARYRKLLFQKLEKNYTHIKKFGIKQLHFHFPNATSFLRFHKPNKFGDDLSDIRYSIVLANKTLKSVSGFEEGRIYNGFRFVYPLIYRGEHIGSVEVSIGFNAINERVQGIYNSYQYMLLHRSVVEGKVFRGEKKNYEVSKINPEFYHEANTFVNYKNELNKKSSTLTQDEFEKINKKIAKCSELSELLEYKDMVMFEKVEGEYYSISFHPIQNIKKKNIGYILSYEKSQAYANIIKEYYGKSIFTFLLIIIIFTFLYRMQKANKKLEEYSHKALEASKSKSEFLANMSHEIRTPLNAILGFVEILQKEDKNRKSIEYVNIIHDASYSLLQIIEDILDFSKIESGKLEIDNIDFHSKKEFEIITHLFEAKCSQKDISLSLLIDDSVPTYIHADPLRIKQVIANLLSNAIKFTENGKKITVTIKYESEQLFVSVIDQGKGIAADKQAHIFKAFSQEDSSTTRKFGGTGLGLSISSELIRLMGGELKLKSELGKGSEFYFFIPITIGETIDEEESCEDEEITYYGKLLLVEDNKTNQKFMQIILDDLGLEIDIANDGVEAIDMYKEHYSEYDLILMDENMPNMGGIESTREILVFEKEENLKHTPIIALTANALKGDKEKFMQAGMDEYISKPVDIDHLTEILGRFLKRRD